MPDDVAPEPVTGRVARALLAEYAQELEQRCRVAPGAPGGVSPAEGLAPPGGLFLVARVDGEPAGCGGLRTLEARTGEVKRLYVRPAHRGRGLSRRVVAALEDAARALGHDRVRLDTRAELVEARALYLALGYRDVPAYNDNPHAQHWMERDLASVPGGA